MADGKMEKNRVRIRRVAATAERLLGVEPRPEMAPPVHKIERMAKERLGGTCDRVFLYHPDAVAAWLYRQYRERFAGVEKRTDLRLFMQAEMPSVTPVCFASMYTGLAPEVHGICKYEKPVLTVSTLFDDVAAVGKRAAIVSTEGDSISRIFLNRDVDYYLYPDKEACNAKAAELIREDRHDLIVLYNGDYDGAMHRCGPEGKRALRALDENLATFCGLYDEMARCWQGHRAVVGFAPDHGCHRVGGFFGNHGTDRFCDQYSVHFYGALPGNRGETEE